MPKSGKSGRKNIYFRQTPKEFKSAKQAEIYEHIKKNIPYRIYSFTKLHLTRALSAVHQHVTGFKRNLPKDAKRVK